MLTPVLIAQFLTFLKAIVRKGLKKNYYKVEKNLVNKVRGKILIGKQMKLNTFKNQHSKVYCEYQEYGIDSAENRYLKKSALGVFSRNSIKDVPCLYAPIKF